ncbi:MAG: hypothetical protein C0413_02420 [Clostridiales bacterium]|nr:hypothetical protein [Clostridiales bacterium]
MYLANNYLQDNESKVENRTVFDDIFKSRNTPAVLEVAERLKQTAGKVVAPVKTPTNSLGAPTRPKDGVQTDLRKKSTVPTSSINGIPDEHAELAAIVDKLPESFDLSEWDDMPALQQQKTLRNSGLTGEEQMKLLNAPTSIKTIATIQDIQANRAQYGITQARADEISSELLKIANARIGVNNRALPFASGFQRNLFLQQLDKEEQKLLESVGKPRDTNFEKALTDNPQTINADLKPIIVNNVRDSKLARTAKDILKFYLDGYLINKVDNAIKDAELLGKKIDRGTISIGVSGSAIAVIGVSGNIGLAMDRYGDVGVIYSGGGFSGFESVSIMGFISVTNASDIEDLNGLSSEFGGSSGVDPSIGLEAVAFNGKNGRKYMGFNILGGVGKSKDGVELHSGVMFSEVKYLFNLYDEWANIIEEYRAW